MRLNVKATMNPKFNVGDRVLVCNDLITTITRLQPVEDGSWNYWFKDENGADKWEMGHAIEICNSDPVYKVMDCDGIEMPRHYSGRLRTKEEAQRLIDSLNRNGEYKPYKMISIHEDKGDAEK